MADLKFVSWKEIFLKALDESDRDKAAQLVHEADLAIYKRQRELGDSPLHKHIPFYLGSQVRHGVRLLRSCS